MAEVRYVPNPAGLRAMLGTPAMLAAMEHLGELVRIRAEEIAPVDTGAYAFGVEPKNGAHDGGFKLDPAVVRGVARCRITNAVRSAPSPKWPEGYPYGQALEWGNSRMKGQRILGRALDAINLA